MYQQVFSAWARPMDDPLRVCVMGDSIQARIEAGQTYATPGFKIEPGDGSMLLRSRARRASPVCGRRTARHGACPGPHRVGESKRGHRSQPAFAGDEYFDGQIDAFSFWGTALSAEQIRRLADGTRP